jgi:hypothetical protein
MLLANLQAELAESLLSEDDAPVGIYPLSNLAIYRNHIHATLLRTLKNAYPLLVRLLAEDCFAMIARQYINQYPSRSADLYEYGGYFADFLADFPPCKELVYLPEVAQFEWLCHQLLIAPEAPPFMIDLTLLNGAQYSQLHFSLHPACAVRRFHYPILRIIDLCNEALESEVNLNEGGVNLLLRRDNGDIKLLPLTVGEFIFLSALQNNLSLAAALDETLKIDRDFDLSAKLTTWITNNIIVDGYTLEGR